MSIIERVQRNLSAPRSEKRSRIREKVLERTLANKGDSETPEDPEELNRSSKERICIITKKEVLPCLYKKRGSQGRNNNCGEATTSPDFLAHRRSVGIQDSMGSVGGSFSGGGPHDIYILQKNRVMTPTVGGINNIGSMGNIGNMNKVHQKYNSHQQPRMYNISDMEEQREGVADPPKQIHIQLLLNQAQLLAAHSKGIHSLEYPHEHEHSHESKDPQKSYSKLGLQSRDNKGLNDNLNTKKHIPNRNNSPCGKLARKKDIIMGLQGNDDGVKGGNVSRFSGDEKSGEYKKYVDGKKLRGSRGKGGKNGGFFLMKKYKERGKGKVGGAMTPKPKSLELFEKEKHRLIDKKNILKHTPASRILYIYCIYIIYL